MSSKDGEKLPDFFPILVDVEAGKVYKWCGCGKSKTQPFCDVDDCTEYVLYHAQLSETVSFCGCKQTKRPPLCDGSHGKVLMDYIKRTKG